MYLYLKSYLYRRNNNNKKKRNNKKMKTKTNKKTCSDQILIDLDHVIVYFLFSYLCIQRPETWSVFRCAIAPL